MKNIRRKGHDMTQQELAERLVKVEERSKSNTHQITEIKPIIEEIHTMSKTMVELITECKHTNENVTDIKQDINKMDERIEAIEQEPANDWKNARQSIIQTIIGVVFGALTTGLITLLAR